MIEKLKKIIEVSDNIQLEQIRKILNLDIKTFNENIFEWAKELGFRIDGDYIRFSKDSEFYLIAKLDAQFRSWETNEKRGLKKVNNKEFISKEINIKIPIKSKKSAVENLSKVRKEKQKPIEIPLKKTTFIERPGESQKKILVVGDCGIGKTTMLIRYIEGKFSAETKMTIGYDWFVKEIVRHGKLYRIVFWDYGGVSRFRFFQGDPCKGADGAIFCFDLLNMRTLENIENWINLVRKNDSKLPILLVGIKLDFVEDIMVQDDYALQFKEQLELLDYVKTSCKSGENILKLFDILYDKIL